MPRLIAAFSLAALAVLIPTSARAEMIGFSYKWSIGPSAVYTATFGIGANLYVAMLEQRIAATAERNPVLLNGTMRLFRARAYARYPALRIFYTYDDTAVYLLYVDLEDELAE